MAASNYAFFQEAKSYPINTPENILNEKKRIESALQSIDVSFVIDLNNLHTQCNDEKIFCIDAAIELGKKLTIDFEQICRVVNFSSLRNYSIHSPDYSSLNGFFNSVRRDFKKIIETLSKIKSEGMSETRWRVLQGSIDNFRAEYSHKNYWIDDAVISAQKALEVGTNCCSIM